MKKENDVDIEKQKKMITNNEIVLGFSCFDFQENIN